MKIKILLSFFLLACTAVFSQPQQKYILPLGEEALLGKTQRVATAPSAFEIIDLTGDSVLGYLPTQAGGNERVAIYAPIPKQEWLGTLINTDNIARLLQTGSSHLLVVTDISIGGGEKQSYARLKGSLYSSPAGNNAFTFVKTIDEFAVNKTAGINSSAANIIGLLRNSLSVTSGGIVQKVDIKPKTKADVIKAEQEKLSFISNSAFPSGVYMSFEELKSLKPSYGQFFVKTDTLSKTVQVNGFEIGDTSTQANNGAFAVAVANELYVYKNKKLYPVETKGNTLVFSKYIDPRVRKNNAEFWRRNIGEQFSVWEYSNPFDDRYLLETTEYRGQKIRAEIIKINSDNGNLEL